MRQFILFIGFVLAAQIAAAHDYFFAFAEVEYNVFSQKIEATISLTGHDFEKALSENHPEFGRLEELMNNSSDKAIAMDFINSHFKFYGKDNSTCVFELIGIDVNPSGTVYFYVESNEIQIDNYLNVTFDLLMDTFSEQQNKITLYYKEQTKTVSFLQHEKSTRIELFNE